MAKSFQHTSLHFDSDLDAILNRVYGSNSGTDLDRGVASIPQSFAKHAQGSEELKQALAELRGRREKAQSAMRMKEELHYLQQQIHILRTLGDQIDHLRRRLEADGREG